jgi:hypothetical protein
MTAAFNPARDPASDPAFDPEAGGPTVAAPASSPAGSAVPVAAATLASGVVGSAVPVAAGAATAAPASRATGSAVPVTAGSSVGAAGARGLVAVSSPARHRRPQSAAADYLRATAINRPAGWDVTPDRAARTLFARAFALAVRRRFRAESPVADIARTVTEACRRHAALALCPLETEMLVRAALGEPVPIQDIAPDRVVATHVVIFTTLVEALALTDDERDDLIAAAEDAPGGQT